MIHFLLDHQALAALFVVGWLVAIGSLLVVVGGSAKNVGVFLTGAVATFALGIGGSAWVGAQVRDAQVSAVEHRYGIHIEGRLRDHPALIKIDGVRRQCQILHPGTHARLFCVDGTVREYTR